MTTWVGALIRCTTVFVFDTSRFTYMLSCMINH